jgi:hypothetical protein
VERLDGITQQHWWDRGDLKNRYIHHETVIREPRTTIVCAKWYDQPDVIRLAEWDKGGRGTFLKRVHALMAEADIIVGHNLDNADVPWLKGDFYLPRIGHPHRPNHKPLPPFKTVDTLKVLRRSSSPAPRSSPRRRPARSSASLQDRHYDRTRWSVRSPAPSRTASG